MASCSSPSPASADLAFFFFGGASNRNRAQIEAYATAITRQKIINPLVSEINVNRLTSVSFIEPRAADSQVLLGYPLLYNINIQNRPVSAQVAPAGDKGSILISAAKGEMFSPDCIDATLKLLPSVEMGEKPCIAGPVLLNCPSLVTEE